MIVDHIAIRAKDIEKVAKWYQDTIGAKVTHTDKYYIRLSTQNTTIAIIDEKNILIVILVFSLILLMIYLMKGCEWNIAMEHWCIL